MAAPSPPSPLPQLSTLSDPIALGRIPILLIPVGPVRKAVWDRWAGILRGYRVVRLSDVPGTSGSAKGGKARYLPPSFPPPHTHLHLSFPTSPPPASHLPLSLFQISLFPLAIIGITDLSDHTPSSSPSGIWTRYERIEEFESIVGDLFPANQVFPLTRRLFGVEEDSTSQPTSAVPKQVGTPRRVEQSVFEGMVEIDASDSRSPAGGRGEEEEERKRMFDRRGHEERLVVIPKDGKVDVVVGMLMADVCASVLTELGEMVTALETPSGQSTLQSSLLPTLTVKPLPKSLSHSASSPGPSHSRPSSVNGSFSQLAVTGNVIPPPSLPAPRPASVGGHNSFPISGPQAGVMKQEERADGTRSTSPGHSAYASYAAGQKFGNSSIPDIIKTGQGGKDKRTSSGMGFANRVVSATAIGKSGSPVEGGSSSSSSGSGNGRLKKLQADFWLLSGRLNEAIKSYEDASTALKTSGDLLWQASAMEGLGTAHLLEAWEGREMSGDGTTPFPTSAIAGVVHDNFNLAHSLYTRSPCPPASLFQHGVESGEGVMTRLLVGCALRHARLMLYIWASGGWNKAALNASIDLSMPRAYPPAGYAHKTRVFLKLSTMSRVSRSMVSRIACRAHGPFLAHLGAREKMEVIVTLCGMERLLGMGRKEGYIGREVVGMGVGMIVERRVEEARVAVISAAGGAGEDLRRGSLASVMTEDSTTGSISVGLGIGGVQAGAEGKVAGKVATRRKESRDGNEALMGLMERVCDLFGVDLRELGAGKGAEKRKESYGWPELQVEVLRQAVSVAERLPEHKHIIRYALTALSSLHVHLSPAAQHHLYATHIKALETARRRATEPVAPQWWTPGPFVLSMELAPVAANREPFEHTVAEIAPLQETGGVVKDPFLYNPRSKAAAAGKRLAIKQEQLEFLIVLRNPFSFDLEINDLSLIASGANLNMVPTAFIIPAETTETARISAMPTETGSLSIEGCRIRLPSGVTQDFKLQEKTADPSSSRDRRRSAVVKTSFKAVGLNSRPMVQKYTEEAPEDAFSPFGNVILCEVVSEQPLLWVKQTSLTHGSVITYAGETTSIHLTLENTSSLPVNFIRLSFDDNTERSGRELIQEGSLSATQTYEIEHDLLHRPVFAWEQLGEPINILPGERQTLSIRCLGKLGCDSALIRVDYGHIGDKPLADSESSARPNSLTPAFYTRRISYPVLFTVYHSVTCTSMNLTIMDHAQAYPDAEGSGNGSANLRLPSPELANLGLPGTPMTASSPFGQRRRHTSYRQEVEQAERFKSDLQSAVDAGGFCLFQIEVMNPSGTPFEAFIERNEGDHDSETLITKRLVPPGSTERLFIPLRRSTLSPTEIRRAIPALSERQFIVSQSGSASHEDELNRALFWYKEELMKQIRISWNEPGSLRHGELPLGSIKFTRDMLNAFRAESVEVKLELLDNESGNATGQVACHDFMQLRLSVRSHLPRSVRPSYRIEPLPVSSRDFSWAETDSTSAMARNIALANPRPTPVSETLKHLAIDGLLTGSLPVLSGDHPEEDVLLGCSFLAEGHYAFRAVVVDSNDQTSTRELGSNLWLSPELRILATDV